jgi:hypothetical protein
MKVYLQVSDAHIITDVITYPYPNYIEVEMSSIPAGLQGGWFKYEDGQVVEYPELKPTQESIKQETIDQILDNVSKEIDKRIVVFKTKGQEYDLLDKEISDIDVVREAKYYALKEQCDEHILAGFWSVSTSAQYGFTEIDQMNMTQQMILFFIDPRPIGWKTEDKGVVTLTKEQFIGVAFEAQKHKSAQINRWWQLKATILAAQTKEEIMSLEWDGTIL